MANDSEMKAEREMSLMERVETLEKKLQGEAVGREKDIGSLRERLGRLERTVLGDESVPDLR